MDGLCDFKTGLHNKTLIMKYYIQNTNAGYLGNAMVFWAKGRNGYTANLDNAEQFSEEEAKRICNGNPIKNKAYAVDYIDSNKGIQRIVDVQYVDFDASNIFGSQKITIPKYEIDVDGLKLYLLSLDRKGIETNWNHPDKPDLMEGVSMEDVEFFKKDLETIPKEKIIQFGEPYLVDALGNDLSIVILTKKKYKLPTGRVIHSKYVCTVISDCRKLYGTPLNGYWKIPSQFLKSIK